ncbi:MAG: HNH endonuclease signature motif containing protein [Alphaproteobacteria bacterium]
MDPSIKRLVSKWTRTAAWRELELDILCRQPWCVYCEAVGIRRVSSVIDHITPHRGDGILFWDRSNLQPLCVSCHGAKSQHERFSDQPYRPPGVALDGTPTASKIASDPRLGGRGGGCRVRWATR